MDVKAEIHFTKRKQIGIGQGMNSEVSLADDPHLSREIVVKEIDRTKVVDWDEYHREAQVMFAVHHDRVVPIHYACLTPTHVCLAMPYYRRGSLKDMINSGPAALFKGYRIAHGILAGVGQIHSVGFLHYDIKPSNILFANNGEPMIADFGQARNLGPLGTASPPSMYKYVIPPEVLEGKDGTVASDIFQVGLTMYRLFNGEPFYGDQVSRIVNLDREIRRGSFPDRSRFLPHVPKGIRRIIRRALKVNPNERYQSAAEMQDALAHVTIETDWKTELLADSAITWTAAMTGKATRTIKLYRGSTDLTLDEWNVELFKETATGERRDNVAQWKRRINRADALNHLETIFSVS